MSQDTEKLINNRYTMDKCVGKGSFGEVYIGYDKIDKHLIAIKVADSTKKHILRHEHQIYQDLVNCSANAPLIPEVYWFGEYGDQSVLVMKYLGNSLEYLLNTYCAGKFGLKTTLMVSIQVFDLLKRLHSCGYIHRDIKPDNFLVGIGHERSQVYLIDFGLAKRYKSEARVHIKLNENKKLTGTARYASVNSHRKRELSRRDDMESLGYLMIYFLKGKLPWQGIPASNKEEKYEKIGDMKETYELHRLCEGVPREIYNFLAHVRSLEFKEKPNYHYLRSLLVNTFNRMGYKYNFRYDWDDSSSQEHTFTRCFPGVGAPLGL